MRKIVIKLQNRLKRFLKQKSNDFLSPISVDEIIYDRNLGMHKYNVFSATPNQPPTVTLVGPFSKNGIFGGLTTLLVCGALLAKKLGFQLRVLVTKGDLTQLDSFILISTLKELNIDMKIDNIIIENLNLTGKKPSDTFTVQADDIFMVSAWWDATMVHNLKLKNKFIYLIQDFEPIFYPNSDVQCFAKAPYFYDSFVPLLNTSCLKRYFDENNYDYISQNGVYFEPYVGPTINQIESINKNTSDKYVKKVFLYLRPHVARNLKDTILRAMDIVSQDERLGEYNISFYAGGDSGMQNVRLSNNNVIKNLGKMEIDDYYASIPTYNVCVSLMLAPHPNYPTLEFAKAGAVVVTTKWETKQSLENYSKNILLADPTPEAVAEKFIEAILLSEEVRLSNFAQNNFLNSWEESLNAPLDAVIKQLRK